MCHKVFLSSVRRCVSSATGRVDMCHKVCGYVSLGVWICVARCVDMCKQGVWICVTMCVSAASLGVDMCHEVCGYVAQGVWMVSLGVCHWCH